MYRGWFPLWRKIEDHPFYKERRQFSKFEAWLDMLLNVQHEKEPQEVIIGMNVFVCNYGESLKSVLTWARRWHWTESKTRRFFKLLKKLNQIMLKSEGLTTRVTILNYKQYDPKATGKPTDARRMADGCATTDKNAKNVKNDKKETTIPQNQDFEGDGRGIFEGDDFYLTKRKRKLTGKRLQSFNQFWEVFNFKKSKADAADAWLDIPALTDVIVDKICESARQEAAARPQIIAEGRTPKYAQGWISSRRWEDEEYRPKPNTTQEEQEELLRKAQEEHHAAISR